MTMYQLTAYKKNQPQEEVFTAQVSFENEYLFSGNKLDVLKNTLGYGSAIPVCGKVDADLSLRKIVLLDFPKGKNNTAFSFIKSSNDSFEGVYHGMCAPLDYEVIRKNSDFSICYPLFENPFFVSEDSLFSLVNMRALTEDSTLDLRVEKSK